VVVPGSHGKTYLLGILVGVLATLAVAGVVFYLRHRASFNAANNNPRPGEMDAADPLSPKPIGSQKLPPHQHGTGSKSGRKVPGGLRPGCEAVRMSALNYDRSRLTGASSSGSSSTPPATGYPRETLNPPPSPVTDPRSVCAESHCCSAYSGTSSRRPYRHYRAINKPPPPTPCSTDVCDESDSYACGAASRLGSEYDSDPFPPPPTPRSHYMSDEMSCPPSPCTERSYFNPLPPPPSPDHSPS
jgi:low density lipoprotein receptor-related protein 5/6